MPSDPDIAAVAKELRDIKMLMVLQLVTAEVKQKTIAQFLGVSEATISRMMPSISKKRRSKAEEAGDGGE